MRVPVTPVAGTGGDDGGSRSWSISHPSHIHHLHPRIHPTPFQVHRRRKGIAHALQSWPPDTTPGQTSPPSGIPDAAAAAAHAPTPDGSQRALSTARVRSVPYERQETYLHGRTDIHRGVGGATLRRISTPGVTVKNIHRVAITRSNRPGKLNQRTISGGKTGNSMMPS